VLAPCSTPSFFFQLKWTEHVARMAEDRKVYKVLVGKSEGKRPLGRPRRRWEPGHKMALWAIGWGGGGGVDSPGSG
jgi:hypothetical protein